MRDVDSMAGKAIRRNAAADLNRLMSTLEVDFVKLSECLVSPGWRLVLGETDATCIHYNISGCGRMIIADQPAIELRPHTLVIVPPRQPFRIEAPNVQFAATELATEDGRGRGFAAGTVRRFSAGAGAPQIVMICGYFQASYGAAIDLFAALKAPIVEQFAASDQLDQKLGAALAELVSQEIGTGAMAAALMKQVLITLLRRSLSSLNLWVERFSILSDPQIARAFAEMTAQPGAHHSVQRLAQSACLSRSTFMARFRDLFGQTPMEVLRELRMRQAASMLCADDSSIEQIARAAGYADRSSFLRVFRKTYGVEPSAYRKVGRAA